MEVIFKNLITLALETSNRLEIYNLETLHLKIHSKNAVLLERNFLIYPLGSTP